MFTRHEIEVCHNIIDRQKQMHEKLFAELRAIKTVLEVPKFRDSMPKTNMHGTDFNTFTKQLGQITKTQSLTWSKRQVCLWEASSVMMS